VKGEVNAMRADDFLGAELFTSDGTLLGEVAGVYVTEGGQAAFATLDADAPSQVLIPLTDLQVSNPSMVRVVHSAARVGSAPLVPLHERLHARDVDDVLDHFKVGDLEDELGVGGAEVEDDDLPPDDGVVYFRRRRADEP
jgi:hypothetical protein